MKENILFQYLFDPSPLKKKIFYGPFFADQLIQLMENSLDDVVIRAVIMARCLSSQMNEFNLTSRVADKIVAILRSTQIEDLACEAFKSLIYLGQAQLLTETEFRAFAETQREFEMTELLSNQSSLPGFCIEWLTEKFFSTPSSDVGILQPIINILGNLGELSEEIITKASTNPRDTMKQLAREWQLVLLLTHGQIEKIEKVKTIGNQKDIFLNSKEIELIVRAGVQIAGEEAFTSEVRNKLLKLQIKNEASCLIQVFTIYMLVLSRLNSPLDIELAKSSRFPYVRQLVSRLTSQS